MEGARTATAADVLRLAQLAAEAVAEQTEGRGGSIWSRREARERPAERTLAEAVADPDQLVLAGTIDGTVIGFVAAHVEPLDDGSPLGVVSDIYVEPEARGIGVGEAMIDKVLAWCEERGCVGVDALALPGNRDTKNFFETFGFKARALIVHRSLVEPPRPEPAEPEVVEVEVADA
ncbi:MAG: GNAT family N-acetyltransferase [Acidimicrobiales bacterium]